MQNRRIPTTLSHGNDYPCGEVRRRVAGCRERLRRSRAVRRMAGRAAAEEDAVTTIGGEDFVSPPVVAALHEAEEEEALVTT